jgi:cell division septation protein DedD
MEKTYFEFKITFLHIVVFLIAVIAIGIFLFYMGYQAGQRRTDPRTAIANEMSTADAASPEELRIVEEKPLKTSPGKVDAGKSIPEEMKLHQEQVKKAAPPPVSPAIQKKPAAEVSYTIQVGAFADFANAQKCSRKFTNLGYPTAIITDNQKKLHTVQVGIFVSLAEAQKEKAKLESLEKAIFTIKKAR